MIRTSETAGNYAQVNGLKMYYEIHGTGKPLVLIHGGGSSIYTTFGRVLPELAKTHQVIGVDLQAHGRTADNGRVTTFEQDADDVAELLRQLQITNAAVFGFSNGASTTMQLAIRSPGLVRKIVVASGFYRRDGMFTGFWDMMKNASLINMPQQLKDDYIRIAPRPQDLEIMHDKDASRMLNFTDWDEDLIRSIKVPALVIGSDADVMTPEHTVKMFRLFAQANLLIFPGVHGEFLGEITAPKNNGNLILMAVALINDFLDKPVV
jgi:pimeloyl-ACP methyl ester carboxylesterase